MIPFNYSGKNYQLATATLSGTTNLEGINTVDMHDITKGVDGVYDRGCFKYNDASTPTPPWLHSATQKKQAPSCQTSNYEIKC